MTNDLATAMRRALEKTRAADPGGATAVIKAALAGMPLAEEAGSPCHPCNADAKNRAAPFPSMTPNVSRAAGKGFNLSALSRLRPIGIDLPGTSGTGFTTGIGPARMAPVPEGAQVETRQHSGPAGSRSYRLFVPSDRSEGLKGLVLMLHGCTQSPEDFALGTGMDLAAEREGLVVAYPAQTNCHNPQACWNWFRPGDQVRRGGEPEILARLAVDLAAEFKLDGRIYAAGLSAGGAMAAVLGKTHPEVFSAIGVHSGLAAGSAHDVASAFGAMRGESFQGRPPQVPAIVFHGTSDSTVSPRNARLLVPGSGVETRESGGGRSWSRLTTDAGSELWLVDGAGHAWFGGDPNGTYADRAGPDASSEMLRFFTEQGEPS